MNKNELLIDRIEEILLERALKQAHGNFSDGLWHYARAYPDESEECGYRFCQGVEASACYPESEYYSSENHPITFDIIQSCDAPSASDSGCIWEENQEGWEECAYIHLVGDWENAIYLRDKNKYWSALMDARNQKIIKEEIPESEAECLELLKSLGFIPFSLGDFGDTPDLRERAEEIFNQYFIGRR